MKRISIIALTLLILAACNNITSINKDPKRPQNVSGENLVSNAEKNLSDFLTTPNQNRGIFRLLVQYWTETTYTDESNYDLNDREIPDNDWDILYRDVLEDLHQASLNIKASSSIDPKVKQNDQACIEILNVYTYSTLVNIFGNVPYSQALDLSKYPSPKFDDANTIYKDLLSRLKTAIGNLDANADGLGTHDIIYNGDITEWKKFGYSLELRLGMTIADVDPTLAKSAVEDASPNAFNSNKDNALVVYQAAPPNTNPVWVNLVQSGRHDFVADSTIVGMMNTLNDPRRQYYFSAYSMSDTDTTYVGAPNAVNSSYTSYSHPSDQIKKPTFPCDLLDYSEVEFLRAEAAARGFTVQGTAAEHYSNAIKASILYWGGNVSQFNSYYNQAAVNWATATGNYKQKIGTQEWLALYNRGMTAWTIWRRLDYPVLKPAPADTRYSLFPVRFTYPVQEQNLNKAHYEAASQAIGGDKVTTKIFWDVN